MIRSIPCPTLLAALLMAAVMATSCASSMPPDPGAAAAALARQGRYDEAAREINLAVRSHRRNVALRLQAADIYAKAGNVNTAVGHLDEAREIIDANRKALGIHERETGRSYPREHAQLDHREYSVWMTIGELETERGNTSDAYVAYRNAVRIAPDDIGAVSGLALAAERIGFDEEAEAAYSRWSELERQQGIDAPPSRRQRR
ncbi:MAG: tetratricopeptide repeat protein [Myxococcota bacterium]